MADSNISLTKTCKNCGLEKPLSAFLVLTGSEGATYGNICADCRKIIKPAVEHDSTTSTTGVKIDSKTKVQSEIDKRKLRQQLKKDYLDEREKRSQVNIRQNEKVVTTARNEKKHRSFLDKRESKPVEIPTETIVFGGEEHKAEAGRVDLTAPMDTRVPGQIKHAQNVFLNLLAARLGRHAPIVKALGEALKDNKTPKDNPPEIGPLNEFHNKNKR